MSTDLEDRLRSMYAAVAEHTVVDDPPAAPLVEPADDHGSRPSRAKVLAVLAVAAVVIGGLAYVVSRERSTTPVKPPVTIGPATGPRTFALPTFQVPEGFGYDQARVGPMETIPWLDGFPGAADVPDATEVGSVRLLGPNDGVFTMVSAPAPGVEPEPGDEDLVLPNGATAHITTSGGGAAATITAAWREPGGPLIGVSLPAVDRLTLELVISNVWIVDRTLWDQATLHGGFLYPTMNQFDGFDVWTPPGDDIGVNISVSGSLQTNLMIDTGVMGPMQWGAEPFCHAERVIGATDDRRLLLISNRPIESFTVHHSKDQSFTVPAGVPPGLTRWRFATVELDQAPAPTSPSALVSCDEVTP